MRKYFEESEDRSGSTEVKERELWWQIILARSLNVAFSFLFMEHKSNY
jgi:hypothetical protein